jgi:hypothetical protein
MAIFDIKCIASLWYGPKRILSDSMYTIFCALVSCPTSSWLKESNQTYFGHETYEKMVCVECYTMVGTHKKSIARFAYRLFFQYFTVPHLFLGNGTGYPGVFQSNPHPYPSKPVPASTGAGFRRYGSGVYKNPWVSLQQ